MKVYPYVFFSTTQNAFHVNFPTALVSYTTIILNLCPYSFLHYYHPPPLSLQFPTLPSPPTFVLTVSYTTITSNLCPYSLLHYHHPQPLSLQSPTLPSPPPLSVQSPTLPSSSTFVLTVSYTSITPNLCPYSFLH